jgi:hypothetical protein
MPEAVVGSDVFSADKADAEKLPQGLQRGERTRGSRL